MQLPLNILGSTIALTHDRILPNLIVIRCVLELLCLHLDHAYIGLLLILVLHASLLYFLDSLLDFSFEVKVGSSLV